MRKLLFALPLALMMTSCISVDYLGNNYQPTDEVAMYFDEADVPRNYEVMGMVSADAPDIISSEKIQRRILERAREAGADAVLFESMDKKVSGSNTNTQHDRYGSYSSTEVAENKVVHAKFIKFKA